MFHLLRYILIGLTFVAAVAESSSAIAAIENPRVKKVVSEGLDWLAYQQHKLGHWTAQGRYPTAMTALSGLALLSEGSTTTQGKYAENLRRAVDYLVRQSRPNGLIGDPVRDDRYTYGHGFSMLFLSEVLGEEEDDDRRAELVDVLTRAVRFTGEAQTPAGGWGYVSSKDGNGFDEGSTTITQVQGLRGCRNAGIPVPKEIIDKAVKYIKDCTLPEGGVQYSSKGGGGRPAITAAAIACLFSAGEYDSDYVPRMMKYCKQNMGTDMQSSYGHWHYAHFYYSQVKYREGGKEWEDYRNDIEAKLLREASEEKIGDKTGAKWTQGYIGPVYTTALNLIILQLENAALPIYQR
ncbi:MAG TPA: prenyltransferase/squalene oxidase repeat-containing protein [Lacipirellulaceae bacterium]